MQWAWTRPVEFLFSDYMACSSIFTTVLSLGRWLSWGGGYCVSTRAWVQAPESTLLKTLDMVM